MIDDENAQCSLKLPLDQHQPKKFARPVLVLPCAEKAARQEQLERRTGAMNVSFKLAMICSILSTAIDRAAVKEVAMKHYAVLLILLSAAACVQRPNPAPPPCLGRISAAWIEQTRREGLEIINLTARIEGRLRIVKDCVVIGDTRPVVAIVPHTVQLVRHRNGFALKTETGAIFPIGTRIVGGGGYGPGDFVQTNIETAIPERCRSLGSFTLNSIQK
jgi:hypothetical protein